MRFATLFLLTLASLAGSLAAEAQVSAQASGYPAYYQASVSSISCSNGYCPPVTLTPVIHGNYVVWWSDAYTDDNAYQVSSPCDNTPTVNAPCTATISYSGGASGPSTPLYVEYEICPASAFYYQNGYPWCQQGQGINTITWMMVQQSGQFPPGYVGMVYAPGYSPEPPATPENPHWVTSSPSACSGAGHWTYSDDWTPSSGCGQITQTKAPLSCSGSGTQTVTVTCQDATATTVDDSYCTDAKPASTQSCALSTNTCASAPPMQQTVTLSDTCPTNVGNNGGSPGNNGGSSSGGNSGGTPSTGGTSGGGGTDGSGHSGPGVTLPTCVPSATTFCVVVPASSK